MGAKRKHGQRYANGRLKYARTVEALNEANATAARKVKAVVLAQPHRRGDDNPMLSDAIGRFCARVRMRSEAYDAANAYAGLVRQWRASSSVPGLAINRVETGDRGQEEAAPPTRLQALDDDALAKITRRIIECETAMIRETRDGFIAVRAAIADGIDIDATWQEAAKLALLALAVVLGRLPSSALPR